MAGMGKIVVALDSTHALLEEGLTDRGYIVERHYQTPLNDLPMHNATGLVVRSRLPINDAFLSHCPQLKWIMRLGAGMENIDTLAADRRGIRCFSAPEGNAAAVAEHAIGMLLAVRHRLAWAHKEIERGLWLREENKGDELEGKTVAVIGYGPMGEAFTQRLKGFGVNILLYDKYKTNYAPAFAKESDENTLLQEADIVSLHLPLTDETRNLVNQQWIESFAKPIFLLNTSRGAIASSEAILQGLESGHLSGVALDVLDFEKSNLTGLSTQEWPPVLQALLAHPRALITPHIAGWSHESFLKMAQTLLNKLDNSLI